MLTVRVRPLRAEAPPLAPDDKTLPLGNPRWTAAKQYLPSHGIDASRIETVSYGEGRPIAQGHTEEAWAQTRRDEFEILAGGENLKQP